MVTPEMILDRLPPYEDKWVLIKKEQFVPDIINEICTAHTLYRDHYDLFSDLFYNTDPTIVADNICNFCTDFMPYKEEPKEDQTSVIPAGMLQEGGTNDCKHYALFAAGIIGSLNRVYGCCFDAYFYFVGYKEAKEPYHVFVSVLNRDEEIWLDPTPGSGGNPTLIVPKKV